MPTELIPIGNILLPPCTRAEQPAPATVPISAISCITDEGNILEQSDGADWFPYSPEPGAATPSNTVAPLGESADAGASGEFSRGDHVHEQKILTADPATPADDTWWVIRDGGTPQAIDLRIRISGVTYVLASVTV